MFQAEVRAEDQAWGREGDPESPTHPSQGAAPAGCQDSPLASALLFPAAHFLAPRFRLS